MFLYAKLCSGRRPVFLGKEPEIVRVDAVATGLIVTNVVLALIFVPHIPTLFPSFMFVVVPDYLVKMLRLGEKACVLPVQLHERGASGSECWDRPVDTGDAFKHAGRRVQ